jgi:hypothetical protein
VIAAEAEDRVSADNETANVLREALVDDVMDELIRDGLTIEDRYDRQQIAKALSPVVVRCLRLIRDRRIPIFNLFSIYHAGPMGNISLIAPADQIRPVASTSPRPIHPTSSHICNPPLLGR